MRTNKDHRGVRQPKNELNRFGRGEPGLASDYFEPPISKSRLQDFEPLAERLRERPNRFAAELDE